MGDVCRDVWVDVRDLATAHVLAITTPDAGGERVIVCPGPFKWQDFGEYFSISETGLLYSPPRRSYCSTPIQ